jgi:hypothetical protein
MAKLYGFIISLLVSGGSLKAQAGKIDTDRPDQTESALTVPLHYFQAELGFNKENTFHDNYDLIYPTALLRYGFKKIELRLEATVRSSYEHLIPNPKWTSGLDPIALGFKTELWEEKKFIPKTSLIAGLGLPMLASKVFRTDHIAPFFRLAMQNSLNDNLSLGYNIGAEWDGTSTNPAWLYTLTSGFNLGEKWYVYAEAFGFIKNDEAAQNNLDTGIAYTIGNNIKIDLSGGIGISAAAPRNYIALGGSFRFSTKRK